MSGDSTKKNPSNNKNVKDNQDKEIVNNYLVSKEGTKTLVSAIHDVIPSPHVRQVLFNVINDVFTPVKEDSPN